MKKEDNMTEKQAKIKWLCPLMTATLIIAVIAQSIFCIWYYRTKLMPEPTLSEKKIWSTLEGAAGERYRLSSGENELTQVFVNQYERLTELILFFYHCGEAHSGQLSVTLENDRQEIFYSYSVEPLYLQDDVFCLVVQLDESNVFEKGGIYTVRIRVENMEQDDYIEVGTTANASKPAVFQELPDGNTLFMELKYLCGDHSAEEKLLRKWLFLFGIADVFLVALAMISCIRLRKAGTVLICALLAGGLVIYGIRIYKRAGLWYHRYGYVVHAMGRIGGHAYSNCLDAFEASYNGGHKVFEVDFSETSDGRIVLKHDWSSNHGLAAFENGYIPNHEEFMEAKVWDSYRTIDLEGLLDLMCSHRDIYIVTDSKSSKYKDVSRQFEQIAETLENYSQKDRAHILDHLIVQIYNDDMYDAVSQKLPVKHYIYTLYQRGAGNPEALIGFCEEHSIPVVVLPYSWWTQELSEMLHEHGITIFVHTLNTPEEIREFEKAGADGIYTDEPELKNLPKLR